jgi:hypothetical protein
MFRLLVSVAVVARFAVIGGYLGWAHGSFDWAFNLGHAITDGFMGACFGVLACSPPLASVSPAC